MPDIIAGPGIAGKNCPYCQTPLKPSDVAHVCDSCRIPHHRECWQQNGGCTTFGCRELAGVRSSQPTPQGQIYQPPPPPQYVQPPAQTYPGGQPYPPAPYGGYSPAQQVKDYLTEAILVTLFCCLPFGIVAIVYASQARSKKSIGDYAGAVQAANSAKLWMNIGLAGVVIYIVLMVLIALGSGGY